MTIYKEGDTITVELTVTRYHDSNKINGLINARYCQLPISIRESDIISHKPRPLQVGDKVRFNGASYSSIFVVLCIDANEAWVKPENGGDRFTAYLTRLERV